MSYRYKRPAFSITTLRKQLNDKYPKRDRASDGIVGDPRHAATASDHNPNSLGIVRAIDIDVDGIPAAVIAENIRKRGAAGDKRLNPGGYVILNRRIASAAHGWGWRVYTGRDPHTSHIHVSVSTSRAGYDLTGAWTGIIPRTVVAVRKDPVVSIGYNGYKRSQTVLNIQNALVKHGLMTTPQVDGKFGTTTQRAVKKLQVMFELPPTGVVDTSTWRALRHERLRKAA